MTKNINYLAIIPARKKSKRIINKNIVKINKKQLVKFTIEAKKKSKKIQKERKTERQETKRQQWLSKLENWN